MIQALPEAEARSHATDTPGTRIRRFARTWGWLVVVAVLMTAVGVANLSSSRSTQPGHHANPSPTGSMAVSEILQDQGVRVVPATLMRDIPAAATADATLFVPDIGLLTDEEWEVVRASPADLVVVATPYTSPAWLSATVETGTAGTQDPALAECTDPDAQAAARISPFSGGLTPGASGERATFCFPTGNDSYGYAVWEEDGRTIRYLVNSSLLRNENLAEDGNAALVLRALGHHPTLVWYQPATYGSGAVEPLFEPFRILPPVFTPLLFLAAAVVALIGLWRGRRMGPVVTEPLPVVVRPGEAVHGRGRLYHRSGSTGHAAAGLRAGTARRLARRLGLNRNAAPHELVAAISAASGVDPQTVGTLLYGTPPDSSAALVQIAADLKKLEESVS